MTTFHFLTNLGVGQLTHCPLGLSDQNLHTVTSTAVAVQYANQQTAVSRQRISKQVSAATDTQVKIQELLGTMFSIWSVPRVYKKNKGDRLSQLSFETPVFQGVNLRAEEWRDGN
jgi:hypothetical protein